MINNLEELLSPITVIDFFENYWESKFLHIKRQQSSFYEGIFSLDAVDYILSSTHVRYPTIRMYHEGKQVPANQFTKKWTYGSEEFDGIADIPTIYEFYKKGATIILQEVSNKWMPIKNICQGIENSLEFPIHANIYLTPQGSSSIPAHYDTVDVFILQIEGKKHWRIWDAPNELPLKEQKFSIEGAAHYASNNTPVADFVAVAGDLIYIPRGHIHQAFSEPDSISLHITLGIQVIRWIDVFSNLSQKAINSLRAEKEYRKGIELDLNKVFFELDNKYAAIFQNMVDDFKKNMKLSTAKKILNEQFLKASIANRYGQLSDLDYIDKLDLNSLVFRRKNIKFILSKEANKVILSFSEKVIKFPISTIAALEYITSVDNIKVREIPIVEDKSKIIIIRRLIKEGFLTTQKEYK